MTFAIFIFEFWKCWQRCLFHAYISLLGWLMDSVTVSGPNRTYYYINVLIIVPKCFARRFWMVAGAAIVAGAAPRRCKYHLRLSKRGFYSAILMNGNAIQFYSTITDWCVVMLEFIFLFVSLSKTDVFTLFIAVEFEEFKISIEKWMISRLWHVHFNGDSFILHVYNFEFYCEPISKISSHF